jgi:elongation factor 2
MLTAKAYLMEPIQKLFINIPQDYMGSVTTEIQTRRGQIINTEVEDSLTLTSKVPVAQMFGFAGAIRSATQGRALWSTEYAGYEKLPASLQEEVILSIRKRKGMPEKIPKVSDFIKEH